MCAPLALLWFAEDSCPVDHAVALLGVQMRTSRPNCLSGNKDAGIDPETLRWPPGSQPQLYQPS
ncbi:hypothetical protein EWB00_000828 [Schistosoma japonicum]|uniref:Uncharacterized protein n=1 Tax=Schistosoma japonicum TaxID=6182 RepID=A0A4Z2CKB9_SCHJA|nr:hypothetical protein EWB00_000828 [Schistosoma japonicum]